ncbi:MAG: Dam family site-specific DNA-(adenine-N6)-methyltransferase [Candidatus Moranbacteria bacterium]|nr:Dam family site-specific DNA-(adenine-N6)-methyltransferase [Candidatus Moranbacteria bacterium]
MRDACFGNKPVSITQRRYLGSKTKLLPLIDGILKKEAIKYKTFADIFAGTGVVADYFHDKANIVVNDILESNYLSYTAFFGKERIRNTLLKNYLEKYNSLGGKIEDNYFSKNFANTYFDLDNSRRIGYIRENIESLYAQKEINGRERAYLVTSLIYALDRIANTVGHYDAYRKIEIVPRALELRPLELKNRKNKAYIYKQDANILISKLKADIVYIDPPYNSRQYSDAYHLLENIASWKKERVFGVAKKINRSHIKSRYSLKSAGNAFSDLINKIEAKFILVSYNDMGTSGATRSQSRISDNEILSALERRGKVTVYEKSFNQFTTGRSTKGDLKERIFFCRVEQKKTIFPAAMSSNTNTHLPVFVKSPLNYTGGKHKLLPQIAKFFPEGIDTFYDVFCGGANVGVNASAKKVVCIDKNQKVVELLKLIQKTNFEELNQQLLEIVKEYGLSQSFIHGYSPYGCESSSGLGSFNKESFLKLRATYNNNTDNKLSTTYLLALVLYSFNNQIRFNSHGHFNLPVGKRDYNGSSRRNLANFSALANRKDITFTAGDFRDLDKLSFSKDDFIYLDPPYLLGLASYNEMGGWSVKHELDLYKTLDQLNKKGVRFALSNVLEHKGRKNTELEEWIRKNNLRAHPIEHNYRNSNYHSRSKNGLTREILVTNY